MADYISRQAAINIVCHDDCEDCPDGGYDMYRRMKRLPAADVVARDCYDRILAENDTMREQLAEVGKKIGDTMDDVRPVVRGKWEIDNSYAGPGLMNLRCSVCGEFGGTWRDCTLPSMLYKFCPNCGADMREPNLDTTKGDNHD